MARSVPRRLPILLLLAACLVAIPFVREDLGPGRSSVPAALVAIVACDLVVAGVLTTRFLAFGSATRLGLACAYLFAGLLAAAHAIAVPGGLTTHGALGADPAPAWLWAAGHAVLPVALAGALWGGPPAMRRRLAAPTLHRGRTAVIALVLVAAVAAGIAAAVMAVGAHLPDATSGGELTTFGLLAGAVVLVADATALLIVARRGRRSELERRLLFVVTCAVAATALTLVASDRHSLGSYAAGALDLLGAGVVLATLLIGLERLGAFGSADERAGDADPLTGVLTRAAALVAAEHLHRTRGPGAPLGLALVDVDGLKRIGDRHGPLAADAVLLTVATRLREQLRDADVLGRAGEEGFLVLLPDTDADGVTLAIDRAVAAVRDEPVGTWAHDVRTTASGGIAMVGPDDDGIAVALAAADLALNQAKAHGRDQVVSPARGQVVPLRRAGVGPPQD
ncbi:GGDEF domain-containing protein [Baekduia soli]|uniref:GGDEF domain-containing protein n=1 Tax=Baekduia soli TaxID=496014 RepID=A0A5B8U6A7_9ACTN|nr:GGDEF domain-containing protein [Baekduia soli]QEC48623.1 GGDEF domain-containing protein [Baekduia soli]